MSEEAEQPKKPLWQRPLIWLTGLVVAAVGGFLTDSMKDVFQGWSDRASTSGPAVMVSQVATYRSDAVGASVAFPRDTVFGDSALTDLNAVRQTNSGSAGSDTSWLEERGGVAVGSVFIQMVVTGNRSTPVRVMNVEVVPECGPPLDGLLFLDPPAGADLSVRLWFDLDEQHPTAMDASADDADPLPYFPDRTISLSRGEEQVLLVEARTTQKYCSFSLRLTVLDEGATQQQEVALPDGSRFQVTARLPENNYDRVFLGGAICSAWVEANEAYFAGDHEHSCDGRG